MEVIRELVSNLAILIILATLLEMLLPLGNLRNFVKMVMGLFFIVTILNPILKFIDKPIAFQITDGVGMVNLHSILEKGKQIQDQGQRQAMEQYKQTLGQQVLAVARLTPEAGVSGVRVELKEKSQYSGEISAIYLKLGDRKGASSDKQLVDPVQVDIPPVNLGREDSSKPVNGQYLQGLSKDTEELRQTIANFYSIPVEKVIIEK